MPLGKESWLNALGERVYGAKYHKKRITQLKHESSHFGLDILHCTFCLTIRLRMTSTGDANFNAMSIVQLLGQLIAKLRAHIMNNALSRAHISAVNVLPDEYRHRHLALVWDSSYATVSKLPLNCRGGWSV